MSLKKAVYMTLYKSYKKGEIFVHKFKAPDTIISCKQLNQDMSASWLVTYSLGPRLSPEDEATCNLVLVPCRLSPDDEATCNLVLVPGFPLMMRLLVT